MQVDLKQFINNGETVAVATSGGSDSMALLDFMLKKLNEDLVAVDAKPAKKSCGCKSKKESK